VAGAALDTFPGATHHIAVLETRRRAAADNKNNSFKKGTYTLH